jgi:hypothetical protein
MIRRRYSGGYGAWVPGIGVLLLRFSPTPSTKLGQVQGRRDEARAMLAEIYNWFTEGFDTADLKDAKALLDQLGV